MPKIGCGLDGLSWDAVRTLIKNVFLKDNIELTVFTLDGSSSSTPTSSTSSSSASKSPTKRSAERSRSPSPKKSKVESKPVKTPLLNIFEGKPLTPLIDGKKK